MSRRLAIDTIRALPVSLLFFATVSGCVQKSRSVELSGPPQTKTFGGSSETGSDGREGSEPGSVGSAAEAQEGTSGNTSRACITAEEAKEGTTSDGDPCTTSDTPPYAQDPSVEKIDWARALRWWPYDPLLKESWLPRSPATETLFAAGEMGETKGTEADPRRQYARFEIFYEYPPATSDRLGFWPLVQEGEAIMVRVSFYPPGRKVPDISIGERVVVRGRPATLLESFRSKGSNRDWRLISWDVGERTGTLQWVIGTNSVAYSREQALEFTERLVEVR